MLLLWVVLFIRRLFGYTCVPDCGVAGEVEVRSQASAIELTLLMLENWALQMGGRYLGGSAECRMSFNCVLPGNSEKTGMFQVVADHFFVRFEVDAIDRWLSGTCRVWLASGCRTDRRRSRGRELTRRYTVVLRARWWIGDDMASHMVRIAHRDRQMERGGDDETAGPSPHSLSGVCHQLVRG